MNTNDSAIIELAQIASTADTAPAYPLQLRYSATSGKGAFFYHTIHLHIARLVHTRYVVRNSGNRHDRIELHDQADLSFEHLRGLIEQILAGQAFQFVFDPAAEVWRGTLDQTNSGAIYNTTVYVRWRSTLVVNLSNASCEYDVYSYEDTST